MIHHPDTTKQSYRIKGMPLLITSHNQLVLTSCGARCLFGGLVVLGSNKSLTVAVKSTSVALEQFGLGRGDFVFRSWHSWLSVLACLACTLSRGKGCTTKNRELQGRRAPMRSPTTTISREAQRASIQGGREEGFFPLPLPCLWIPQSQRRLVNRAGRPSGETRCKALFKQRRESAVDYAASTEWSGPNFSPFVESDWKGAPDYCPYLWRWTW